MKKIDIDTLPKLIITVDTEPDDQWSRENHLITVNNIEYVSRFQELCEKYNVRPTYLLTSSMANSNRCIEVFKTMWDSGGIEIGAHLHPWETKPFFRGENVAVEHAFPHEFSYDELLQKLVVLTDEIGSAFGLIPRSYRAGRYGICMNQIRAIDSLGYMTDCSVTPNRSWITAQGLGKNSKGGDFFNAPIRPYRISNEDLLIPGAGKVMELPITILYLGSLGILAKPLVKLNHAFIKNTGVSILRSKLRKLNPRWFRPLPWYTLKDLIEVVDEAIKQGLPYIQMIIHSSEFMPTGSPYWVNKEHVDHLFNMLESLFNYTQNSLNLISMTVNEFSNWFDNCQKPVFVENE